MPAAQSAWIFCIKVLDLLDQIVELIIGIKILDHLLLKPGKPIFNLL